MSQVRAQDAFALEPDLLGHALRSKVVGVGDEIDSLNRQLVEFAASPATEPLYPIDPFEPEGVARMVKTHPPLDPRVRRLRELGAGQNGRVPTSVSKFAG